MNCTYCNAYLIDEGVYGYLASHQSGEVLGRIYRCPNHDGFDDLEEALEYLEITDDKETSIDDVVCDSSIHHVSGSFYTDNNDNLYPGYPC